MIEAIQAGVAASTQAGTGATAASQSQAQHSPQAAGEQMREFAASMERAGQVGPAGGEGDMAMLSVQATGKPEGTRAVLQALESLNGGAERIESMSHSLAAGSSDFTPADPAASECDIDSIRSRSEDHTSELQSRENLV